MSMNRDRNRRAEFQQLMIVVRQIKRHRLFLRGIAAFGIESDHRVHDLPVILARGLADYVLL